jgi:hypothetical protein
MVLKNVLLEILKANMWQRRGDKAEVRERFWAR